MTKITITDNNAWPASSFGCHVQVVEAEKVRAIERKLEWKTMDTSPKDRLVLLSYRTDLGIDYDVGYWAENYGCPGWRAAGTFIKPIAWLDIPEYKELV